MEKLTPVALSRATLARQLLLERAEAGPVDAIGRLAGMQGQEPKHPYVGLWTRLAGFAEADLDSAVAGREVVRATLFRGTLHLVTAADFLRFRTTVGPVLEAGLRVLKERADGLEREQVVLAARELLTEQPMTFAELRDALQQRFPAVNERALGFCVRMLVPLVMEPAPVRWSWPATARFTLAEQWIGREPVPDAVPGELLLRYLAAFGPATPADFQTWSGLTQVAPLFDTVELEVVEDEDGRRLYDVPGAPRPDAATPAPVRFLPEFDNLLLAYADRRRVIADEHRPAVFTRNLRVKATYLVDGTVAGLWTVASRRGTATLTLTPFGRMRRIRPALEREGDALLRFLEPDAGDRQVVTAGE